MIKRKNNIIVEDIKNYYDGFSHILEKDQNNPRHIRIKQTLTRIIKNGWRVLDVGCGVGIISKFIVKNWSCNVVSVDISPRMIEQCRLLNSDKNIEYLCADIVETDFETKFDVVLLNDVFEHIARNKIKKLVKKVSSWTDKLVYLNVPDGRYLNNIRNNTPDKLQIVDESYSIYEILGMFEKYGYRPFYISIYGIEAFPQYVEFVFWNEGFGKLKRFIYNI